MIVAKPPSVTTYKCHVGDFAAPLFNSGMELSSHSFSVPIWWVIPTWCLHSFDLWSVWHRCGPISPFDSETRTVIKVDARFSTIYAAQVLSCFSSIAIIVLGADYLFHFKHHMLNSLWVLSNYVDSTCITYRWQVIAVRADVRWD